MEVNVPQPDKESHMGQSVKHPLSSECSSYYQQYVDLVPDEDLVDHLARQSQDLIRSLSKLSDGEANSRYAPGKWSVKQVLGHILDTERVMGYRLLRIARGDNTPLHGFDQDTYALVGRFDERPIATLMREYGAVRAATIELIQGLGCDDMARFGTANNNPVSARAIAWIIAGHEIHHVRVLREKYRIQD
jgi:hypothetical protein